MATRYKAWNAHADCPHKFSYENSDDSARVQAVGI